MIYESNCTCFQKEALENLQEKYDELKNTHSKVLEEMSKYQERIEGLNQRTKRPEPTAKNTQVRFRLIFRSK